jgi:hypothetical protein
MRISLVWTRGELINRNTGKKHKSPSKIERDNRRSDTLHAKQESNKIESEGEIDESENSQSSEMETESEDEHIENTEVISPKYSYSSIIEPIHTTNGFGKLSIII